MAALEIGSAEIASTRWLIWAGSWAAESVTDLVLGAQVVHIVLFALEHLAAELTYELKAETIYWDNKGNNWRLLGVGERLPQCKTTTY